MLFWLFYDQTWSLNAMNNFAIGLGFILMVASVLLVCLICNNLHTSFMPINDDDITGLNILTLVFMISALMMLTGIALLIPLVMTVVITVIVLFVFTLFTTYCNMIDTVTSRWKGLDDEQSTGSDGTGSGSEKDVHSEAKS